MEHARSQTMASKVGIAVCIGLALTLVACSSGSPDSPSIPTNADGTDLTVTITNKDRVDQWNLTCDPEGGNHPSPRAACSFLDTTKQWGENPFDPVPADAVCAEVYAGEEIARVMGFWNGKPIDAIFTRINACETGRWSNAIPLLVVQGS
jgi:hypothetical protein